MSGPVTPSSGFIRVSATAIHALNAVPDESTLYPLIRVESEFGPFELLLLGRQWLLRNHKLRIHIRATTWQHTEADLAGAVRRMLPTTLHEGEKSRVIREISDDYRRACLKVEHFLSEC